MAAFDVVVLAGGSGSRFEAHQSASIPKQFALIRDVPVFIHTLRALNDVGLFRNFLVAMPEAHLAFARESVDRYFPDSPTFIIAGGKTRQESSLKCLQWLEQQSHPPDKVAIHDACRPCISESFASRIREALTDSSALAHLPVLPVTETLKRVKAGRVNETVDRSELFRAQTPQIFDFITILNLTKRAIREGIAVTDDSGVCEAFDVPVRIFAGDGQNLKLTYPEDMATLRSFLPSGKTEEPLCEQASDTTFTV